MKDIRILYETFGAEEYYRAFGEKYENPHEIQVKNLIIRNLHRWDCSGGVLDFCAGGGEVTRALQQSGVEHITGCDPFTYALYEKQTGLPCARYFRGLPRTVCFVAVGAVLRYWILPKRTLSPNHASLFPPNASPASFGRVARVSGTR